MTTQQIVMRAIRTLQRANIEVAAVYAGENHKLMLGRRVRVVTPVPSHLSIGLVDATTQNLTAAVQALGVAAVRCAYIGPGFPLAPNVRFVEWPTPGHGWARVSIPVVRVPYWNHLSIGLK